MPIDPSSLSPPIRKMIAGVTVLGIVCALATVRYVAAGWSVADAFYMVVINIPQLAARWSPGASSKAFTSRGVTMRDEWPVGGLAGPPTERLMGLISG